MVTHARVDCSALSFVFVCDIDISDIQISALCIENIPEMFVTESEGDSQLNLYIPERFVPRDGLTRGHNMQMVVGHPPSEA